MFPRVFLPSARPMSGISTPPICCRSGLKKTGTNGLHSAAVAVKSIAEAARKILSRRRGRYPSSPRQITSRAGTVPQTPDTQGGEATTSVGAGVKYDQSDDFHLLGNRDAAFKTTRQRSL